MNELQELQVLETKLAETKTVLTPLGIEFDPQLTFEQWAETGKVLRHASRMLQWCVGDWAAFGDAKFGKLREFATLNGMNAGGLVAMAAVAAAVPIGRRVQQLEWSFHEAVAGMKPKDQSEWLQKAIADSLDISDFRKSIRLAGADRAAVRDDDAGAVMKHIVNGIEDFEKWYDSQPREFWTEFHRQWWRQRLARTVQIYNSLGT